MKRSEQFWALLGTVALFSVFVAMPISVHAAGYTPANIISEREYTDKESFSKADIQAFLERQGSGLATIKDISEQTNKKVLVSQLFFESAQFYNLSPKLLLTTAQKEQSAITTGNLSSWQKNALMGYAVYPGNDESPYLGIANQIDAAAWQYRRYLDKPQNFPWQAGEENTTSDGYAVTPENQSTAALYNYTPYAGASEGATQAEEQFGGNFSFWKIWNDWFARRHPNGTLIRAEGTPGVYLLVDGKKRGFWSRAVFKEQYSDQEVLEVSSTEIDRYGTLAPQTFPDGVLLEAPNGAMFVVEKGKRRGIVSPEIFRELGYNFNQSYKATELELDIHEEGALYLEEGKQHADGTLVKQPDHPGVYFIKKGKRHPVEFREVFESRFKWEKILTIPKERLLAYPEGASVGFRDGSLIEDKENKRLFFIEDGKKRLIPTVDDLVRLGYETKNVIRAPHEAVLLHERGEDLIAQ